ncbi:MAG: NAD-dependent epimerase [Bacteroidota bacterium]
MKILVTGTAGFIGFHLANRLITDGHEVVGLDIINDYYDQGMKYARLALAGINKEEIQKGKLISSKTQPGYRFVQLDLKEFSDLDRLFTEERFDTVVNLAAQAGVRYSLINPRAYIDSNIVGFSNILECCRHHAVKHLVYASSSSVYGLNKKMPLSTDDNVDHPISLYAASKKSNELMAHTYSHLFNLPTTGLRFFTVYGPWGRPDMAPFLFTNAILKGEPIKVFNHGKMKRDFTYIDDIIEGTVRVINDQPAKNNIRWKNKGDVSSKSPYRIYNIGNGAPVPLMGFIEALEDIIGLEADKKMLDIQPGDVVETFADTSGLVRDFNYQPRIGIEAGVKAFVHWFRDHYQL